MSWKQKGISMCRRAISGQLFQSSNLKESANIWLKSATKTRQKSSDCVQSKPKNWFDEAPVPEGSWSENYKNRDAKDTKILSIGVVSFLITAAVMQKKGIAKGHPEISFFF